MLKLKKSGSFFCEFERGRRAHVGLIADWQEEEKLSPNHSPSHTHKHSSTRRRRRRNPQTLSRKADSESQQESAIRDPRCRIVERTIKQEKCKQKPISGITAEWMKKYARVRLSWERSFKFYVLFLTALTKYTNLRYHDEIQKGEKPINKRQNRSSSSSKQPPSNRNLPIGKPPRAKTSRKKLVKKNLLLVNCLLSKGMKVWMCVQDFSFYAFYFRFKGQLWHDFSGFFRCNFEDIFSLGFLHLCYYQVWARIVCERIDLQLIVYKISQKQLNLSTQTT